MNINYILMALGSYIALLILNAYGFWRIAKVKGWNYSLNLESNEFIRDKILRYGLAKIQLFSFSVFTGLMIFLAFINDFAVAVATGFFLNDLVEDLKVIRYEIKNLKDYSKDYVT